MIGIKVWEHLTLVPIMKDFDASWIFSETRRPLFHPQPNDSSVPVGGLTINSTVFGLALLSAWSSLLEAWDFSAGNELQIIFFVTSNRENLRILDNVSKINVSSDILSSTFQNSFFQSERNFKLPSIIQYLLIQNLINKQTG